MGIMLAGFDAQLMNYRQMLNNAIRNNDPNDAILAIKIMFHSIPDEYIEKLVLAPIKTDNSLWFKLHANEIKWAWVRAMAPFVESIITNHRVEIIKKMNELGG